MNKVMEELIMRLKMLSMGTTMVAKGLYPEIKNILTSFLKKSILNIVRMEV